MQAALSIDHLTKTYNGTVALDDLSLDVQAGECFGFLGPNGAGKTTTIRLLLDLIRPTSGKAFVLGYDCHRQSHVVRAMTGYLPGDLRFYPGLTGWETLELLAGLRAKSLDLAGVERIASILELDLTQQTRVLSKGNRQKLGIAVALFDHPAVYLLDEPTSGLDPITQHLVWELLREEAANGSTVFFSSHVMSEVEQVCQRVAILRKGRLVAVEPIAELKERLLRRIEITFASPVPADAFTLPGIREIVHQGSTVRIELSGNLDEVIKTAAHFPVLDLRTEQASLDEVLLAYYRESER